MVITIMRAMMHDDDYLYITSKDKRFKDAWMSDWIKVSKSILFSQMEVISDWANNTLKEECLFEVE